MPRKTTKPTAEERRAAAAPSVLLPSTDAPPAAVAAQDDGELATRGVTSVPGPAEARAILAPEDQGVTERLAPSDVTGSPAPKTVPSHYEVVHAAVGGHYKGERVEVGTFTDEQSGRLLTAGAIIPHYEAD